MKRLDILDYVRGFAALAILLYHTCSWTFGQYDASTLLGRVGIYGVSIFYLLSGLTFYLVYQSKFRPKMSWGKSFFLKRFLRIFPLLWIATFMHLLFIHGPIDVDQLIMNATGLFAFFSWDHYFATGAWSIGNELVFYALLPLMFIVTRKFKSGVAILLLFSALLYGWFAFFLIDGSSSLSEEWYLYTNPLNQVFLFVGGFAIGHYRKRLSFGTRFSFLLILFGAALFMLFPVTGERLQLICGVPRIVFTLACGMVVLGFSTMNWQLKGTAHHSFRWLGHISYSLYLLHPIVFESTNLWFGDLFQDLFGTSAGLTFILAFMLSIGLSSFSYQFIEKPMVEIGRMKWRKRKKVVVERKRYTLNNPFGSLLKRIAAFRLW